MTAEEVTDRGTDREKRRVTNREQRVRRNEKIPEGLDTTTVRIVKRGPGKKSKT